MTTPELMAACDMDQDRVGYEAARWRLYKLLRALEADGLVESWTEPGSVIKHGPMTKHYRRVGP